MLGEGGVQQTTIKTPWKSGRSFRLLTEDQRSASQCKRYQKTQRSTPESSIAQWMSKEMTRQHLRYND
jgi:hypothetical protein